MKQNCLHMQIRQLCSCYQVLSSALPDFKEQDYTYGPHYICLGRGRGKGKHRILFFNTYGD